MGGYGRRTSQAMCITSRTETRIKRKSNHHRRRISYGKNFKCKNKNMRVAENFPFAVRVKVHP